MQTHWAEYGAPVYIPVNAFMGHKPPEKSRSAADFDDFEADMAAAFPEGWG
jgi:hypothetical protein